MTAPLQPFDEFVSAHIKKSRPRRLLRMHSYDVINDIDRVKKLCEKALDEGKELPACAADCEKWEERRKRQAAAN